MKLNRPTKLSRLGRIAYRLLLKTNLVKAEPITGRITADPNPLPADADSPATLRWETNAKKAELYLSRNNAPEKRVSGCTSGSFDVKRIKAGVDYVFRLYKLTEPRQLLTDLKVTREIAGRIAANPNPVPIEAGLKTTLTWEITPSAGAEVRLSEGGLAEKVVCQRKSGSLEVDWLRPGVDYSFRLYNQRGPRRLLDQVTVRLSDTPSAALLGRLRSASAGIAKLIAEILPGYLHHKDFPKWFRLWEKSGFHVTPVHFYQPIPDSQELREKLWGGTPELAGIEMNDATQLHLLRDVFPQFREAYERIPPGPLGASDLFYLKNSRFEGLDPMIAYCMVRHFRPRQIVEVGGGYSTLLLAQAARENANTMLLCIDPYPEDFLKGAAGLTSLLIKKVEDVDLSVFARLEADDCLFIDTSHVVKIGGDVNFLFLEVLPRLKPGVIVHVHDIFLPFEYPQNWVIERRRFWTEQYLLRAFLIFNSEFEVLVSCGHLYAHYIEELKATFPTCEPWYGGSFWMRRKTKSE